MATGTNGIATAANINTKRLCAFKIGGKVTNLTQCPTREQILSIPLLSITETAGTTSDYKTSWSQPKENYGTSKYYYKCIGIADSSLKPYYLSSSNNFYEYVAQTKKSCTTSTVTNIASNDYTLYQDFDSNLISADVFKNNCRLKKTVSLSQGVNELNVNIVPTMCFATSYSSPTKVTPKTATGNMMIYILDASGNVVVKKGTSIVYTGSSFQFSYSFRFMVPLTQTHTICIIFPELNMSAYAPSNTSYYVGTYFTLDTFQLIPYGNNGYMNEQCVRYSDITCATTKTIKWTLVNHKSVEMSTDNVYVTCKKRTDAAVSGNYGTTLASTSISNIGGGKTMTGTLTCTLPSDIGTTQYDMRLLIGYITWDRDWESKTDQGGYTSSQKPSYSGWIDFPMNYDDGSKHACFIGGDGMTEIKSVTINLGV